MGRPTITGKGHVEEPEKTDARQDEGGEQAAHHDDAKDQGSSQSDDWSGCDVSYPVSYTHLTLPTSDLV